MMSDHVLWVDNDPILVQPFADTLCEFGWTVTFAKTATEAILLLQKVDFSIVLLDVMIPLSEEDDVSGFSPEETLNGAITGLALYRRVRNHLEKRRVPVIVLTIRADQALRDEFAAAGLPPEHLVSKFLVSDPDELIALLRSITTDPKGGA
jgi:CheY-like chemotaxis protein